MFSDAKNRFSISTSLSLALILSLLVVIPLTPERATAAAGDGICNLASLGATGNGNVETPWGISTSEQLWEITDCPGGAGLPGGNFVLLQDIDVADALAGTPTQSPIGLNITEGSGIYSSLRGVLDGAGHTISFSMSISAGAALFHSLDGAEIRNLIITGSISSNPPSDAFTAGLAIDATKQNTISNVTVATVIRTNSSVGGFVGEVPSSSALVILNSKFTGAIEAQGATFSNGVSISRVVGGFVGRVRAGTGETSPSLTISGSESVGTVNSSRLTGTSTTFNYVGGFVGRTERTLLNLSGLTRSSSVVSGGAPTQGTGGVAGGILLGASNVSHVFNLGDVEGQSYVGGLIGLINGQNTSSIASIELHHSLNLGSITGEIYVGGAIGSTDNFSRATISGVVNNGQVTATTDASGGIVGFSNEPINISNSLNSATISITANNGSAGGILGYQNSPTGVRDYVLSITDSTNSGVVGSTKNAGGIIGASYATFTLSNVANTGKVSVSRIVNPDNASGAGGLVGYAYKQFTIENSRNSGQVISNTRSTGGLVGQSELSLIIRGSANEGSVSGLEYAGGFLGQALGSSSTVRIEDSTNSGNVQISGSSAGGFLGAAVISAVVFDGLLNSGTVSVTANGSAGGVYGFTKANTFSLSNLTNVATISATSGGVGGVGGQSTVLTGLSASGLQNSGNVIGRSRVGGIFGWLPFDTANAQATISRAVNSGMVSISISTDNAGGGGIVGEASGQVTTNQVMVSFLQVGNLGTISGSNYVGGVIGYSKNINGGITIKESFNEGNVSGVSSRVGGLAGFADKQLNAVDAYSTGTIRGLGDVGGLVGFAGQSANLTRVFAAATFSATSGLADGLDAGNAAPTTTSAFTSTTSRYAETTGLAEFRSVGLYTGWDFETVWAFGECAVLGELPVLRWANPSQAFSTTSCFVVVPQATNSPAPSGSSTAEATGPTEAPGYFGPLISAVSMVVFRGEIFELRGTRLDSITSLEIQGIKLRIVSLSSASMTLEVPSVAVLGIQDLVLFSSYGRLSVIGALDVRQRLVSSAQFGDLLGFQWSERFQGNARSLSQDQMAGFTLALDRFSGATTVVCWGYTTAANPNAWAIAHATLRARNVCSELEKLQPTLKTFVRVRYGVPKSAAVRSSMQFWELRARN